MKPAILDLFAVVATARKIGEAIWVAGACFRRISGPVQGCGDLFGGWARGDGRAQTTLGVHSLDALQDGLHFGEQSIAQDGADPQPAVLAQRSVQLTRHILFAQVISKEQERLVKVVGMRHRRQPARARTACLFCGLVGLNTVQVLKRARTIVGRHHAKPIANGTAYACTGSYQKANRRVVTTMDSMKNSS
jgi:hypothetical protein